MPATVARYADSKSTIYSATSPSIKIDINPKRRPNLVLNVDPPAPIKHGGQGTINVTVKNDGDASAYRVVVKAEVESQGDGLELLKGSLDESFFEIPQGSWRPTLQRSRGLGAESTTSTLRPAIRAMER